MQHPILTHLAAVVVGFILCKLFFTKAQTFVDTEIAAITSKIESLKATDLAAYTTLMSEWKAFLGNKKAKIANMSSELKTIVSQIKNL